MKPRYAAWVAFIERRYRAILGASLVLTLLSGLSLAGLRFDFDVLSMLPTGAPAFDNFKTFVADFGELDELVILVEGQEVSSLPAFADTFVVQLRALDTVSSVYGRIDPEAIQSGLLGPYLFNYVPAEAYDDLAARLTADGIDAQVAADRAILQAPLDLRSAQWVRRDPLGIMRVAGTALAAAFSDRTLNVSTGYLSNADGTALLILVRPTHNAFDIAFTTHFMEQVRAAEVLARSATTHGDALHVGYTGSYAFALEDAATLKWDVGRYTVLALFGVLAVFYAGYRNLRILPFVTYPLLVSTLLTFAASLLIYAQLNAVSMAFAAILYGLSIDSGIYYYTRLSQELQTHDLRDAVAETLRQLGGANVVASTTTAAAFFVIGFSQLAGISQLGFLTAIGMLFNIAQFFLLYPALTFWMSRRTLGGTPLETPRLGRLAAGCAAHPRPLLSVVALFGLALCVPAARVDFDVDLTHLRPAATAASRVQDAISARFGADVSAGAVLVRAPRLEDALQASEAIAARLAAYRSEGLVQSVHGVSALLPSERTQRDRLARFQQLPRERIAQDLRAALVRHGFRTEPFDEFLTTFTQPHTAVLQWGDAALQPFAGLLGRHIRQRDGGFTVATYIEPAAGADLAVIEDRLRRDVSGPDFIVAGRSLLQAELRRLLRRELVGFCVASFALNLLLVLCNFPRLGMALALILPEMLVIVCLLALLQLTGMGVDPVNLIVVPLILGIGVDNCVYLAARQQSGESWGDAVRHGGRALTIAAVATMAGFGFLGLSHYPALARMGTLAAASLFLCLLGAITVLPALLSCLVRVEKVR